MRGASGPTSGVVRWAPLAAAREAAANQSREGPLVVATQEPTQQTAEDFAHGLSARALHCRELGHTWRAWTVTWDRKARCYDRALRCSSCQSVRHELLDSTGDVLRSGYRYSKGYLATNVQAGTLHRSVFRMESISRFLERDRANLEAV